MASPRFSAVRRLLRDADPVRRLLRDVDPVGRLFRDAWPAVGLAAVSIAVYPHLPYSVLVVAMCAPLVLRRAYPWAALAASTVAAAVHVVVLAAPTASVVAVPIMVHSLARWSTIRVSRAALVVGLTGAVVGPARWLNDRPESPTLTGWVTTIVGYGAVIVAVSVAGRRAHERDELRVQQERERAERHRLALADRERAVRRAAEDERHEVAREIHDLVAHSLAVIAVQAEGGRAMAVRQPHRSAEVLAVIADTSREALDELRRVVAMLRRHERVPAADYRPAVGLDDVGELVARLNGRAVLCVRGDRRSVGPLVGLTAYRIVQESLTNVLRHAGPAARAEVAIAVTDHDVTVRVHDDGHGGAANSDGHGTGLVAMRERVQLHDGTLRHGPRVGGGFEVHAVLPLPPVHHPAHDGGAGG